jgi:spore germination protein KA
MAVSIIGALVIGEAAITANLLSPGVIIIVSASGITGFVVPSRVWLMLTVSAVFCL